MRHLSSPPDLRLFLALIAALASPAWAHDSWFAASPTPRAGEVRLSLATGNLFPKQESSVGAGAPVASGCRHGDAPAQPLRITRDTPQALLMHSDIHIAVKPRASAKPGHPAITCWAQLVPLQVNIAPEIVPNYLKEIDASPALRSTWAEMLARGVPWKETYTKHARIERFDARLGSEHPPPPQATPMGMDIVLDGLGRAPMRGDELAFTLLRDGQPLAGLPVELKSALTRISFWTQTDGAGRAKLRVPLAGEWLLRAVDLRLSTTANDEWDSRFVTLAFEVH